MKAGPGQVAFFPHQQRVARAAAKAISARQELEAAIREARAAGSSLRSLAAAAGMSHEQVRRIAG